LGWSIHDLGQTESLKILHRIERRLGQRTPSGARLDARSDQRAPVDGNGGRVGSCAGRDCSAHSARARRARLSSGPAFRPLTQTRPKFRTLAPRASASRSSCTTSKPRRRAMTACMVPSTPPPAMTTRVVNVTTLV
jgi:hypothetical protein